MKIFFLKVAGMFFVALAALGAILPLLPTTPFLLLAASCFAKSSPRFHQKLLSNNVFGPLISNWQTSRTIPKKAKIIALLSIVLMACYSSCFLEGIYLKFGFIIMMMIPIVIIVRLPLSAEYKAKKVNEQ